MPHSTPSGELFDSFPIYCALLAYQPLYNCNSNKSIKLKFDYIVEIEICSLTHYYSNLLYAFSLLSHERRDSVQRTILGHPSYWTIGRRPLYSSFVCNDCPPTFAVANVVVDRCRLPRRQGPPQNYLFDDVDWAVNHQPTYGCYRHRCCYCCCFRPGCSHSAFAIATDD